MFSSQKINHDPFPCVWIEHTPLDKARADTDVYRKGAPDPRDSSTKVARMYEYAPRPEYDNNPNPILVQYRRSDEKTRAHMRAGSWISWPAPPYPDGAKEHARKVLAKLATLHLGEKS